MVAIMRPLRRAIPVVVVAASIAACQPQPREVPATRPNLLLLVIDCLRADHLSSHGYARPTTPNIDRLAAEGTTFRRAYAQASWTKPSLPTILSGLYPSEHGVLGFRTDRGTPHSAVVAPEVELVSESLSELGWSTALIGNQSQLSPQFGLAQGFDLYRHDVAGAPTMHRAFFEWIASREVPAQPWFVYLHYIEIHAPYCPPSATRGRFEPREATIDACLEWRTVRDDVRAGRLQLRAEDGEAIRARYDEELLALDQQIGSFLEELARRAMLDNTLIVVTSDHGEEFLERGGVGHGQSLHEEVTAVPLIVRPPAMWSAPRGRQHRHPVETRVIAPTLVHAATGGRMPTRGVPSVLPTVLGWNTQPVQAVAVSESVDEVALRTEAWTLITRRDGSDAKLFERKRDAGERVDLSRARRREMAAMRELFAAWKAGIHPAHVEPAEVPLDEETAAGLRALGYLGGRDGSSSGAVDSE